MRLQVESNQPTTLSNRKFPGKCPLVVQLPNFSENNKIKKNVHLLETELCSRSNEPAAQFSDYFPRDTNSWPISGAVCKLRGKASDTTHGKRKKKLFPPPLHIFGKEI